MLRIGIKIIFFSIFLFAISSGIDDYSIKISDDLTLHSGDIITLQASDKTYATISENNMIICLSDRYPIKTDISENGSVLLLTPYAKADENCRFTVETAKNNQIMLREGNNGLYLGCNDVKRNDKYFRGEKIKACIRPGTYIQMKDTFPGPANMFKVVTTGKDNKIALYTFTDKCLWWFRQNFEYNCNIWGDCKSARFKPIIPMDCIGGSHFYNEFTVDRVGIDPDYVQSVEIIELLQKIPPIEKPLIYNFTATNPSPATIETLVYLKNKEAITKKVTWEKGTELAAGTKVTISADVKIPEVGGVGIGQQFSMDIKSSTKDTNEYAETKDLEIEYSIKVIIPPWSNVNGSAMASIITEEVGYKGLVTVESKDGSRTYSYPINGTIREARLVPSIIKIYPYKQTEQSLIKPNASQFAEPQATVDGPTVVEVTVPTSIPYVSTQNETAVVVATSDDRLTTYTINPINETYQEAQLLNVPGDDSSMQ